MDIEEGQRPRVVTGGMQGYQKCLLISLGIGLLTMVIVLPLSFSGVEYYEVGICLILNTYVKNTTAQKIVSRLLM